MPNQTNEASDPITVEISEKGKATSYRGTLISTVGVGKEIRIILDPKRQYYISSVKRIMHVAGENHYLLDSADGRRYHLKVIEKTT